MSRFVMTRNFPLPRIQTGAVLGNSFLGVMVWGGDNICNISLGCSALWDHRGGLKWNEKQNFKDIHAALLRGDLDSIREMFRPETELQPGQPRRPSLVPVGRVVLTLGVGATFARVI